MYEKGLGVDQDYGQALDWYERSANQNLHRAQHNLARLYKNLHRSDGAFPNYEKAKEWYEKAAKGGYIAAQIDLAHFYIAGHDQAEPDYKSAVVWLQKAADSGSANAQVELGKLFEHGQGVEKSPKIAFDLYKKAADQDFSYAYSFLADMYLSGSGVEKSIEEAKRYYRAGVSQNERNSMYRLAVLYLFTLENSEKYAEAIALLHRAVDLQNGFAAYLLAEIYAHGGFGVEKNATIVLDLIPKAVPEEQVAETYLQFADLITLSSTKRNKPVGLEKLYEAAIHLKDAQAMSSYAWALRSGSVFQKDIELAKKYFHQASELDEFDAYAGLGLIELDRQTSPDLSESYKLCSIASKKGEQCGDYCLGLIYFRQIVQNSTIITAERAEEALNRSATNGNSCSMLLLGLGYELGYFEATNPHETSLSWLRKASETGNLDATFNLGMFLIRNKDQRFEPGFEAYDLINEAANGGHRVSQCAYVAFEALKDRVDIKLFKLSGYLRELADSGTITEAQAELVLQDPRISHELSAVSQISKKAFRHPDLSNRNHQSDITIVE